MDIISELIYEITTFNFIIWLLVFLTLVLLGIPYIFAILNLVRRVIQGLEMRGISGEKSQARILGLAPSGKTENNIPEMVVELEIQPKNRPFYRTEKMISVRPELLKKIKTGSIIPVWIDGNDASKVTMAIRGGTGPIRSIAMFIVSPTIFVLFFWVVFGYIFAFSIKNSSVYDCAVSRSLKDPKVIDLLGSDVKPGFFAWISNYESGGAMEQSYFRVMLSGSKGTGNIYVGAFRTPGMDSLSIDFDAEGGQTQIYNGTNPCR